MNFALALKHSNFDNRRLYQSALRPPPLLPLPPPTLTSKWWRNSKKLLAKEIWSLKANCSSLEDGATDIAEAKIGAMKRQ
jgi:hypothetical protein